MKEIRDPCYQLTKKIKTVLYTDGVLEDFALIKKTREDLISAIRIALYHKYSDMTKEQLIEELISKDMIEINKSKNDDLEILADKLIGFGHVINEPCPYNGIHCSYGDINGLTE